MPGIQEEYEALIEFLYLAPVGLIQTTGDGTVVLINPLSAQLLMPLTRNASLDNLFEVLADVAPDLRHQVSSFDRPSGSICEGNHIHVNAALGSKFEAQILSLSLYKLDDSRLMAVLNDVTLQVKRERIIRQNEVWFNAIAAGVTDYALISLDAAGSVCDWNSSIENLTGMSREDVQGKPYSVFSPADSTTPDQVLDRLHEAHHAGWSLDEGWRLKADGSRFWGSVLIAPLRYPPLVPGALADMLVEDTEPAYSLILRDITDRREAGEIHRLATSCDHLTGIANRRSFFEAAERELARRKQSPGALSLVIFDADHFKLVNDTYGHPAGDAVLCHLAKLLTATFRQVDVVARVGGEEFAVLLPSADLHNALNVANRLRETVAAQTVEIDGAKIRYTVSGGVATLDDSISTLADLMKMADKALYEAKKSGRNRIEPYLSTVYVKTST
jgi:diguanylate cyclase (GGDEF)-like protein/PAS domain S-box-containing protein